MTDLKEVSLFGQGQRWNGLSRVSKLVQTEFDPIGMQTAEGQGLGDGLLDQLGRVILAQPEDLDELTDGAAGVLIGFELHQELFVDRWPFLAPTADRFGMLKSTRTLLEQR